jgi:hypothetical protein
MVHLRVFGEVHIREELALCIAWLCLRRRHLHAVEELAIGTFHVQFVEVLVHHRSARYF